jgi:hypothetical protein
MTQKAAESVTIELNTRQFLNIMVHNATQVVSTIVEIASNSCSKVAGRLSRSPSSLEMPPPMIPSGAKNVLPLKFAPFGATKESGTFGLDLLCNAAAELPVVSPVLTGSRIPDVSVVDFDLTSEDDDVVAKLSVDQCEDIVDTCLFGGDCDKILETPCKRARIEE